jgi:hypothetical protein
MSPQSRAMDSGPACPVSPTLTMRLLRERSDGKGQRAPVAASPTFHQGRNGIHRLPSFHCRQVPHCCHSGWGLGMLPSDTLQYTIDARLGHGQAYANHVASESAPESLRLQSLPRSSAPPLTRCRQESDASPTDSCWPFQNRPLLTAEHRPHAYPPPTPPIAPQPTDRTVACGPTETDLLRLRLVALNPFQPHLLIIIYYIIIKINYA